MYGVPVCHLIATDSYRTPSYRHRTILWLFANAALHLHSNVAEVSAIICAMDVPYINISVRIMNHIVAHYPHFWRHFRLFQTLHFCLYYWLHRTIGCTGLYIRRM